MAGWIYFARRMEFNAQQVRLVAWMVAPVQKRYLSCTKFERIGVNVCEIGDATGRVGGTIQKR
jgi:hypothetical protein